MDAGHISISECSPDKLDQDREDKAGFAGPRRVIWELVHRCNTYCGHSHGSAASRQPMEADRADADADRHAHRDRDEPGLANADLTTAESLALITELVESGVSTVVFACEPHERPDWPILVQHAKSHGLTVENTAMGTCEPDACQRDGLTPRICADGTVTPCMYSMTRIGSLRRHSLLHIWTNSPLVAQLRTHIRNSPSASCTACEHRGRSARMNAVARRALLMDYPASSYRSLRAAAS